MSMNSWAFQALFTAGALNAAACGGFREDAATARDPLVPRGDYTPLPDPRGPIAIYRGYVIDDACGPASVQLYDREDRTGGKVCIGLNPGRRLFFQGFDLGRVCKDVVTHAGTPPVTECTRSWKGAVRSYQAGSKSGYFQNGALTRSFAAAQIESRPPTVVHDADILFLDACPRVPEPALTETLIAGRTSYSSDPYGTACTTSFVIDKTETEGKDLLIGASASHSGDCKHPNEIEVSAWGYLASSFPPALVPLGQVKATGVPKTSMRAPGFVLRECLFNVALPRINAAPYTLVRVAAQATMEDAKLPLTLRF